METGDVVDSNATAQGNAIQRGVSIEIVDAVAVLRLGSADERAVVLDRDRMDSLRSIVSSIKPRADLRGLIISGANERMFCAGADVHAIENVTDPKIGAELARLGQEIFSEIEALPFPTVAAVAGACVGGGCELILACKYRLALNSGETKIGLPEIKLGILPGFGGTQRLPRLIGLPQALDIILKGRVVSAKRARAVGLVDELVECPGSPEVDPLHALERRALEVALGNFAPQRKRPRFWDRMLTNTKFGRNLVRNRVEPKIRAETKGHYPAPLRALDVAIKGLEVGFTRGLEIEAQALGELISTSACKALVHLYFLTEVAGKLGRAAKGDVEEATVGVLGAGVMGAGIAGSFVQSGHETVIVDQQKDALERARVRLDVNLKARRSLTDQQREELLGKLILSSENVAFSTRRLVIEAVVEDVEVKQKVLSDLAQLVKPECILATNTSSLRVAEIAKAVAHPERVVGLHFFNPVEKMPLVEIVRTKLSSEKALVESAAFVSSLGKYPVVVEDSPGFLVNRILVPYVIEAVSLLDDGISFEDIDRALEEFGMPMGPFRMLDEVGLDIAAKVQQVMSEAYGDRMQGPSHAEKLVAAGLLGKKRGGGFYRYESEKPLPNSAVAEILGLRVAEPVGEKQRTEIVERIVFSLVNEAIRVHDEGVAGDPGPEAAGQIDLASVMGMGFAPFRGGVLHYGESIGAKRLEKTLWRLQASVGLRLTPAEGLQQRAKRNGSLYEAVPKLDKR